MLRTDRTRFVLLFKTSLTHLFTSFVFDPYTWNVGENPYTDYNGHLIPSRIPMSALISGATPYVLALPRV